MCDGAQKNNVKKRLLLSGLLVVMLITISPSALYALDILAGTQGSAMFFFIGRDLRLPPSQRLYLDPVASIGYFNEADVYINGNPEDSDSRAGSSSSDKNDFITGDGWDNYFRLNPPEGR